MLLLECSHIKKYFGDRLIFEIEQLKVYAADRIGIVGANGVGKTSLLKILSQRLAPDEGWVKSYGKVTYLAQLEPPEHNGITPELAAKFGVPTNWADSMSGGEQTRFKLAQSFGNDSVMLCADEPTSNLDVEGIQLLENWFADYQGALVLISHDRALLDKLCTKIWELEEAKLKVYNGNYSAYSDQKAQARERAEFEYTQYVNEKKRLERVSVDLNTKVQSIKKTPNRMGNSEARLHKMGNQKAKATLDRAIKNTAARIKHLEPKEKPVVQQIIKLDVADSEKIHSKTVIEGKHICKDFGTKVLFKEAEFRISNGAKVALIGPNGCGKSTLLKMIMARDTAISIAPGAKLGYFSQDLGILDENLSVLENVMMGSSCQESLVRTLLARLLFKHEAVHKNVAALSGGERVKVALAQILVQDINLLILDEPTNYMDINSLEVIEEALRNYERSLLFVSHDRRFVSSVADHIMTIENQKIKVFQGGYEEYLANTRQVLDSGKEDVQKRIFVLQHRLSEIIGRLSLPSKHDDLQALDQEYHQVLNELKRLK